MRKGITLIGMTGAGKTTVGPLLGKLLGWPVCDVDNIIIQKQNRLIGKIVEEEGQEYLQALEIECVLELDLHQNILVTPGSIVYDEPCHAQLKQQTKVVWLDAELKVLISRLGRDPKKAGAIVGLEGGFTALFKERLPLYRALADITIACETKDPQAIAQETAQAAGLLSHAN